MKTQLDREELCAGKPDWITGNCLYEDPIELPGIIRMKTQWFAGNCLDENLIDCWEYKKNCLYKNQTNCRELKTQWIAGNIQRIVCRREYQGELFVCKPKSVPLTGIIGMFRMARPTEVGTWKGGRVN